MNSADSYINYTIDLEATGKNIRTLMKMTGYTVRELERLIGCTQMTFFNWEEGKNLPGFDNLTEGDTSDDGKFYPDRGDIVQLSGKTILVLTKEKHNRATHFSHRSLSCRCPAGYHITFYYYICEKYSGTGGKR